MFPSSQWFWLSLYVLDIQNSFSIDCDKLCKVIEILWEMALQLVPSLKKGCHLCCHPEFYRKFRLKQIRGKPLIRAYTSAPFPRVPTLPCIYHFLTQRVVIIFLVVLSMLNKFKLIGIEDMFKKFEFTLYFEKCSRLYSYRKCNGATNKLI